MMNNEVNLAISSLGLMVVTFVEITDIADQISISVDGGRSWRNCMERSYVSDRPIDFGWRMRNTLGINDDGYLYILGGWKLYNRIDDVTISDFSFYNISFLRRNCGYMDVNPASLGLQDTTNQKSNIWKTRPQIGDMVDTIKTPSFDFKRPNVVVISLGIIMGMVIHLNFL